MAVYKFYYSQDLVLLFPPHLCLQTQSIWRMADGGWPRQMCLRLSLLGLCGSRFGGWGPGIWLSERQHFGNTHLLSLHLSSPLDPRN